MRTLQRLAAATVLVLALAPLRAAAAEDPGLGLDLSADEPKKDDKKGDAPPPSEPRAPVTIEPSARPEGGELTEKEIASEDRVKSVQRKAFLKKGRFELTPMLFFTVNDAFFPKFGPGLRASYFPHDSFGFGARFFQYNQIPNDNVRLAKRQLQSRLPFVLPKYSIDLDLLWSPVYGKVSLFNSIKAFEIYLVGGAGGMVSQTSPACPDTTPDCGLGDGVHLSTHIGLGQRLAIFDFLAVDVSAIEALYADRPSAGTKAVIQHVLSVNLGLSLYLPPTFEYKP